MPSTLLRGSSLPTTVGLSPLASPDALLSPAEAKNADYGAIHQRVRSLVSQDDGGAAAHRSPLAHAFFPHQDDLFTESSAPRSLSHQVQLAINSSLVVNIVLAVAKTYAAYSSGSLAVLSSLVDSILDLASQALFWYSDKRMHTKDVKYPAGRRRLEPIAVIISATLMGMAAIEVIQKSVETLVAGCEGKLPEMDISRITLAVLLAAIATKLVLWFICHRIASLSPSADALAQDHRNDVFSNSIAIVAAFLANWHSSLWFLDPAGAIAISIYIAVSWLETGKEQVERLVGLQANQEFIDEVRRLADMHHPLMKADIVRAYHFGNNYLVELEVILPENMRVREAHDISLSLQKRVEELDCVERAFVHVDYLPRDYDEHKDPTIRRLKIAEATFVTSKAILLKYNHAHKSLFDKKLRFFAESTYGRVVLVDEAAPGKYGKSESGLLEYVVMDALSTMNILDVKHLLGNTKKLHIR